MPEVVGTFSSPELRHEGANCSVETPNGSLGSLAQVVLEFAVGQFDGIEVGRVLKTRSSIILWESHRFKSVGTRF
jgi:hypothetical protein